MVKNENVSARITAAEREALEQLCKSRAAGMEQMGIPGDASFAGWLRTMIRKESKAAGLTVGESAKLAENEAKSYTHSRPVSAAYDPSDGLACPGDRVIE